MNKFTVIMKGKDGKVKKEVYADNAALAVIKADPKGKYKNYSVVLNNEEIVNRRRI